MSRIEEPRHGVDHLPSTRSNHELLERDADPSGEHGQVTDEVGRPGMKGQMDNQGNDPHGQEKVSTAVKEGTGFRLAIAALLVFIVLGIGFAVSFFVRHKNDAHAQKTSTDSSDATPGADVVTVLPTDATYPLTLPGQTGGWFESEINARVPGYVDRWIKDIGDPVTAGQALMTIETPELDQQMGAAVARANASAAQIKVAAANESIADITNQRWQGSKPGVVSEQERQEKKAAYDSSVAQLEAAQAQHQLDEAEVQRLNALEGFKQVLAPYDGVVTGRYVDNGDLVTAGGAPGARPLYTIAQPNVIRTFVNVPQKLAPDMVYGLDATATTNQFPGQVFRGTIARSTRSIDPQSRTERTEVDIPNKNQVLLPGMAVEVTFQLKQRGLVRVPAASILFKPEGLQVAVVNAQNKVEFRPITVAKDNGETVELDSGVKANERVALNISNYIVAGEKVTPVNVDKEIWGSASAPPPTTKPAPVVESGGPPAGPGAAALFTPAPDSGIHPPAPATVPLVPVQSGAPTVVTPPSAAPSSAPSTEPTSLPSAPARPGSDTPAGGGGTNKLP